MLLCVHVFFRRSKKLEVIEGVVESLESDIQEVPNNDSLRNYYSISTSNKKK